jgi:hypothetical protein
VQHGVRSGDFRRFPAISGNDGGPRRLIEDPAGQVFVAQTLDLDGAEEVVRETEIVLHGVRSDRALDFLVYNAAGNLVASSTFQIQRGFSRTPLRPCREIAPPSTRPFPFPSPCPALGVPRSWIRL